MALTNELGYMSYFIFLFSDFYPLCASGLKCLSALAPAVFNMLLNSLIIVITVIVFLRSGFFSIILLCHFQFSAEIIHKEFYYFYFNLFLIVV